MLLLGVCVVVLGASAGVLVSNTCPALVAHSTEHESRHVCKLVAVDTDISHIAMHKDRQGPGGTLVVGVPAVVLGVVLGTGPNVVL